MLYDLQFAGYNCFRKQAYLTSGD